MIALFFLFLTLSVSPFKSKSRLKGRERGAPSSTDCPAAQGARSRPAHKWDRLFLVLLYRWFPSVLRAITIIRPEILVRWKGACGALGSCSSSDRHGTNLAEAGARTRTTVL